MPPSMLKEAQARSPYSPKPIEFAPGTQINPTSVPYVTCNGRIYLEP